MPELRNTPTGVGKTKSSSGFGHEIGKHPHGRGEDYTDEYTIPQFYRNTPTGVGKTILW